MKFRQPLTGPFHVTGPYAVPGFDLVHRLGRSPEPCERFKLFRVVSILLHDLRMREGDPAVLAHEVP